MCCFWSNTSLLSLNRSSPVSSHPTARACAHSQTPKQARAPLLCLPSVNKPSSTLRYATGPSAGFCVCVLLASSPAIYRALCEFQRAMLFGNNLTNTHFLRYNAGNLLNKWLLRYYCENNVLTSVMENLEKLQRVPTLQLESKWYVPSRFCDVQM